MIKRPHHDRRGQIRKRTRPSGQPQRPVERGGADLGCAEIDPSQLDLMTGVAAAVESSNPLELLELISTIAAIDLRGSDAPGGNETGEELPSFRELLDTFIEVRIPETSAILSVAAATQPDELLRARLKRELLDRRHSLPGWLRQLDLTVTGAERVSEPFGDGENIALGVRIGSGHEFSFVVYIEHQSNSSVKDAFIVDQSLRDTRLSMNSMEGSEQMTFTSLDRADARAKLDESVSNGEMLWPPFESDTWPALRPLLGWVLNTMPANGTGWSRPEWSEDDKTELVEGFFSSAYGRDLDSPVERDIVHTLILYGTDYSTGDPRVWSPMDVEILLLDWLQRKMVADGDYFEKVPGVLRAFIPYAHDLAGLPPSSTEETLAALKHFESEYQRHSVAPNGPSSVALHEGVPGVESFDSIASEVAELLLRDLAEEVGGVDALQNLDDSSLPDEEFVDQDIDEDIGEAVSEVRTLLDDGALALYDVEFRTACRRMLHDVAVGDPQIFRRKSSPARTAAAIALMTARTNSLIEPGSTQELHDHFGVKKGINQRIYPMQEAIGLNPYIDHSATKYGTDRYMTSARRIQIISERDRHERRRRNAASED